MRYQLLQLARNLRAGARLAFLLRVGRLEFRVGLRELVVLFLLSAVLDIGNDWVRYGPGAYFSLYGAGSELFAAAMLLGLSALLALAFRQHALALSLPVFVLSALAFVQLVRAVLDIAQRWWPVYARQIPDLDNVFTAWAIVVLIRTVAIALDRPPTRRLL